jgi:IS605 OrfB family transposase
MTRRLVNQYDLICIENLTLGFMTANRHLALSAHDAALGEFRSLLAYKAEEAGRQVVSVPPQHTSQMCSGCGRLVAKSLRVRVHRCEGCGLELDRDVNAARNILTLGRSVCDIMSGSITSTPGLIGAHPVEPYSATHHHEGKEPGNRVFPLTWLQKPPIGLFFTPNRLPPGSSE